MPEIITLDWLQLHVRSAKSDYPERVNRFEVKRQNFRTKQFKNVDYIYKDGEGVATMVSIPHSNILHSDSGLLKIENKYLYSNNLETLVDEILNDLELKFVNVTRIDIACDFNLFKNNLHPANFIFNFLSGKYVKLKRSKFSVYGVHERVNEFQYLRFGSPTSVLCYYLYNKSVELRERKNKPYIKKLWVDNNLDDLDNVWRLEFRITASQRGLVDCITGEALPFATLDVLNHYNEVYRALFFKYMDFRLEDGQRKKDRMKQIPLLNLENPERNYMRLFDRMESNRMDKIFVKKMVELNNELRGTDFNMNVESQKLLMKFINRRDLGEWFAKKFPEEVSRYKSN